MKVEELIERGGCIAAQAKMEWYKSQMKNNNGMLGFPSHYPILDKYTSGIIPGKVYTIAAYSNVGKSRFVYGYINHFLSMGKKVVFFNLEVDKGMCFLNLCCNRYDLYSNELKDRADVFDFMDLTIFDDIYTLPDIMEASMLLKPDIIVIDFVQNVQTPGVVGYESMATIARSIQQLAIQTNATVFSLSQLSNNSAKELNNGNTDFVPLKGAGEFTASSDIIFILRQLEHQLGLTVVKTKYAQKPRDEIVFNTDFGRSKFYPVEQTNTKLSSSNIPF